MTIHGLLTAGVPAVDLLVTVTKRSVSGSKTWLRNGRPEQNWKSQAALSDSSTSQRNRQKPFWVLDPKLGLGFMWLCHWVRARSESILQIRGDLTGSGEAIRATVASPARASLGRSTTCLSLPQRGTVVRNEQTNWHEWSERIHVGNCVGFACLWRLRKSGRVRRPRHQGIARTGGIRPKV